MAKRASEMYVRISLGNSAMMTSSHVADALRSIADRIDQKGYLEDEVTSLVRGVMDSNGATVGEWGFKEEEDSLLGSEPKHNHFGELFAPQTCPGCKYLADKKEDQS